MLDPKAGGLYERCAHAWAPIPFRNVLVHSPRTMHVGRISSGHPWTTWRTAALGTFWSSFKKRIVAISYFYLPIKENRHDADRESVAEDLGLLLMNEDGGDGLQSTAGLQAGHAQLGPSPELQQLAFIQCNVLVSTLEYRVRREGRPATGIRCALYCRSPMSLPQGQLQLHLVAASDVREAEAAKQRHDLILGMPEANGPEQEAWLVEQNLIVLPDSGGLVLPLAHASFLVGLLVVECVVSNDEVTDIGNEHQQRAMNATLRPPACSVFSNADLTFIRQIGSSLALACAMDLNALLEKAGNSIQRRKMQGLVTKAKTPLRTLRGLSSMLRPRLRKGEPEHDMNESIIAQGEELNDLVNQLQNALSVSQQRLSNQADGSRAGLSNGPQSSGLWPQSLLEAPPPLPSKSKKTAFKSTQSSNFAIPTVHPALPSSSIGADNIGGRSLENVQEVVNEPKMVPVTVLDHDTELSTILNPIITSAGTFARIGGVSFDATIDTSTVSLSVSIGSTPLKQIISQYVDIALACVKRGDAMIVVVNEGENNGRNGAAVQILISFDDQQHTRTDTVTRCVSDFDALSRSCRSVGAELSVEWSIPGPIANLTANLWLPCSTMADKVS